MFKALCGIDLDPSPSWVLKQWKEKKEKAVLLDHHSTWFEGLEGLIVSLIMHFLKYNPCTEYKPAGSKLERLPKK